MRQWGPVVGSRYIDRVQLLEAAERIEHLYDIRALDFHPLTGDRRGQHALRLTGQMRLILTIVDDRTVIVEEVRDYHD